jgi:S-adenosylmethionine/arginine decarboxylase-like enzyme
MLDISGCNDAIKSYDSIYNFNRDLIKSIDMTAHGDPVIEYLLPGDPKQGFSLMQLITTSNICAHFVEPDGSAYIDIFSCKTFDILVAQSVVQRHFEPKKMRVNYITRNAG